MPGDKFFGIPLVPLLSVLAALGGGLLLGALSFWLLLRRSSNRSGEPVRVDFSAAPIYAVPVPSASTVECQPPPPDVAPRQTEKIDAPSDAVPDAIAALPPTLAEVFDPGPMYAEVAKQRQETLLRHEEGILHYLVDENIKLLEQIGQLKTVAYS